jgi:hypothetical protein
VVKKETVSPRRFFALAKEQEGNIRVVLIKPARLGESHWGKLQVEYKKPLVRLVKHGARRNR